VSPVELVKMGIDVARRFEGARSPTALVAAARSGRSGKESVGVQVRCSACRRANDTSDEVADAAAMDDADPAEDHRQDDMAGCKASRKGKICHGNLSSTGLQL
jgi:hypothetical protein